MGLLFLVVTLVPIAVDPLCTVFVLSVTFVESLGRRVTVEYAFEGTGPCNMLYVLARLSECGVEG